MKTSNCELTFTWAAVRTFSFCKRLQPPAPPKTFWRKLYLSVKQFTQNADWLAALRQWCRATRTTRHTFHPGADCLARTLLDGVFTNELYSCRCRNIVVACKKVLYQRGYRPLASRGAFLLRVAPPPWKQGADPPRSLSIYMQRRPAGARRRRPSRAEGDGRDSFMGMRGDDGFHRARRSRLLCLRLFSMGIYFRFTVVRWFFI
jgi:hypothetical protein